MDIEGPIKRRNSLAVDHILRALSTRQMNGYYAETKEDALKLALQLIPQGASVGWGGSMSTEAIGLNEAVRQGNYQVIDRDSATTPEERTALMKQCLTADVFRMGTNALTEDGQLENLDGKGNRVAALIYGPERVIVIAGMNKVVKTLDDAISRTRNIAAPINAQRFDGASPCRKTGLCGDCMSPSCICAQLVITRFSMDRNRIHVILVNEDLGY